MATKKTKIGTLDDLLASPALRVMREVYDSSRCACGCCGTWDKTVSGAIGDKPAIWMGCERRNGSSVGGGIVDQCPAVRSVIAACSRLGVSVDDVVETRPFAEVGAPIRSYTGPLAAQHERELFEQNQSSEYPTKAESWWHSRQLYRRDLTHSQIELA